MCLLLYFLQISTVLCTLKKYFFPLPTSNVIEPFIPYYRLAGKSCRMGRAIPYTNNMGRPSLGAGMFIPVNDIFSAVHFTFLRKQKRFGPEAN